PHCRAKSGREPRPPTLSPPPLTPPPPARILITTHPLYTSLVRSPLTIEKPNHNPNDRAPPDARRRTRMRADVSDVLKVGDRVTITDGLSAGMDGEVVEVVHVVNPWAGRARLRLPEPLGQDHWHPFWSDAMDEAEWLTTRNTSGMERFLDKRDPPWRRRRELY